MNSNSIKSDSILKKRIRRFKSIKRGYYSLIILTSIYIISLIAPILISKEALMIRYANGIYDNGEKFIDENNNAAYDESESFTDSYDYYFPAFSKMFESIIGPKFYEASFRYNASDACICLFISGIVFLWYRRCTSNSCNHDLCNATYYKINKHWHKTSASSNY